MTNLGGASNGEITLSAAVKKIILAQLDIFIVEGQRLAKALRNMLEIQTLTESELRAFVVGALDVIARIAGESSDFYKRIPLDELKVMIRPKSYDSKIIPATVGSLMALRLAVESGLLISLEDRLRASIHDDFLQQAQELLDVKYHVAAMVLIGGVLEDHLRKLCANRSIATWTGHGNLTKYNEALWKESVFTKPEWRGVTKIVDVRNDAAHGDFEKVQLLDVKDAWQQVSRILTTYPA